MPQIPEFQAEFDPQQVRTPEMDASAAGAPGAALARGAAQIGDVADAFAQRYADARRATDATDQSVALHSKVQDLYFKWAKVPDMQQAATGFAADVATLRKQSVDTITDPLVRSYVTNEFDKGVIDYGASTKQEAFHRESAAQDAAADGQLNDLAHRYAQAPTEFEKAGILDTAKSVVTSRVQGGFMDADAGEKKFLAFRSRADEADAMRDIDADPTSALARLDDPKNYPNMDEFARGRLIGRAESKAQRADAGMRGDLRSRYDDNLASIEQTGQPTAPLSSNDLRAAFPGEADEMLRRLDLAGGVYQAKQATPLTSPDQDKALLDKWQPKGVGFADQDAARGVIMQALNAKWKAIDSDPPGYILGVAPEIAAQFSDAQKDPSKLRPAFAALDAAYDKLGMPADQRPLFSADAAQRVVQSVMADPTQAPAQLKTMEQQSGNYWPRMFHDLVNVGKLPPQYQAVATLDNQRDGAQLARWISELPSGKSAGDLLGAKVETQIKADVRSNPDVQSFMQSLSRSGSSGSQVENVLGAIDALAFAKTFYDHDPRGAQEAAASFTSKYEFMPDGGARVPRANFDAVSANARNLLDGMTLDKIAVPAVYGRPGMPKPDEFLDQLKSSPSWITSPNADSLWLMDVQGRIVRDRSGKPVSVPFNAPAPQQRSLIGRALNAVGVSQ